MAVLLGANNESEGKRFIGALRSMTKDGGSLINGIPRRKIPAQTQSGTPANILKGVVQSVIRWADAGDKETEGFNAAMGKISIIGKSYNDPLMPSFDSEKPYVPFDRAYAPELAHSGVNENVEDGIGGITTFNSEIIIKRQSVELLKAGNIDIENEDPNKQEDDPDTVSVELYEVINYNPRYAAIPADAIQWTSGSPQEPGQSTFTLGDDEIPCSGRLIQIGYGTIEGQGYLIERVNSELCVIGGACPQPISNTD